MPEEKHDRKGPAGEIATDEGLVSRWSRLKQEARAEPPAPAPGHDAPGDDAPEAAPQAEPVRVEDLPDVEELTYESDFTAFLREGVPEELKRLALRKLWRTDPVFANLDGLNDYDLDYRVLGADTRVTEALLAQREVKEKLLRGGAEPPARPRGAEPSRPSAAEMRAQEAARAAEAENRTGDAAEAASAVEADAEEDREIPPESA